MHFLLGPTTVALALPLWDARSHIRRAAVTILAALIAGSTAAVASALAIAYVPWRPGRDSDLTRAETHRQSSRL